MSRQRTNTTRDPALRENILIGLAVDLAEKKLRDGTASSQIITTLLQLATTKYKLELEKMQSEITLKEAQAGSLNESDDIKELYSQTIDAIRSYRGMRDEEDDEEDWDEYD